MNSLSGALLSRAAWARSCFSISRPNQSHPACLIPTCLKMLTQYYCMHWQRNRKNVLPLSLHLRVPFSKLCSPAFPPTLRNLPMHLSCHSQIHHNLPMHLSCLPPSPRNLLFQLSSLRTL